MRILRPGQKILTIGSGLQIISPRGGAAPPFSPTDIAGLMVWIDFSDADTLFTDAGSTKVSSDGDAVYQANDKSGENGHAIQSTSGYRPLYKTAIQNGLAACLFDGSDDHFIASNAIETTEWTILSVYKSTTNGGLYISGRNTSNTYGSGMRTYATIQCGNNNGVYLIGEVSTDAWHVVTGRMKSEDYAIYANGSSIASGSGTVGGVYTAYIPAIGGHVGSGAQYGGFVTGYIGEILMYNSSLSDTNRQAVEAYLNNKWNIY